MCRWEYKLAGPTTVHLMHEVYLVVCMAMLTASSLVTMYRYSFGTAGDWKIVLMTSLWLGRYMMVRFLCTSDLTSSGRMGLRWIKWFVVRFVTAGQYWDPPRAISESQLTKLWAQYGTQLVNSVAWLVMTLYNAAAQLFEAFIDWKQTVSDHYSNRALRFEHKNNNSNNNNKPVNSNPTQTSRSSLSSNPITMGTEFMQQQTQTQQSNKTQVNNKPTAGDSINVFLEKYWHFIPPLQLVVACATGLYCIYGVLYLYSTIQSYTASTLTYEPNMGISTHPQRGPMTSEKTPPTLNHFLNGFAGKVTDPLGPQRPLFVSEPPSVWLYFVAMSSWGTLASLIIYGRMVLPFPDLVSGISYVASKSDAWHLGALVSQLHSLHHDNC